MRHLVLAVTVLVAQQGAWAAVTSSPSPTAAAKGMHCFKSKQYNLAVYHLRTALQAQPKNALWHYYLANSLVHMHKHKEAIASYRASYELDPFGTVSGFCRQALLTYNVSVPVVVRANKKPLPAYKEGSPQNKVWQEKPSKDSPEGVEEEISEPDSEVPVAKEETFHDHHVNNATAMIRRQAADEKARKKQIADHLTSNVTQTGASKASKIKAEAEEQIKEMYEGPMLYDSQGNFRGRGVPAWRLSPILQDYLKERADQIRREADSRAQLETSISHDKSGEYKKWLLEREEDMDYVTDSLESQLHINGSRSGVSLNPVGTGLYVRNYSTFKPRHPIPEAHSSVVRMLDRGFEDSENDGAQFKIPPSKCIEVTGKVVSE